MTTAPKLGSALDPLEEYIKCKNDPWYFLTTCVFTHDQADQVQPVKQYPDLDYLRFVVRVWQREKLIAVPKSRRMIMSWTMIPLAVWDCIFHRNRTWAFVSKKENDAGELVERALYVYRKIPESRIPRKLLPKIPHDRMTQKPPSLVFDFGNDDRSKIQGYPTGADQLRQFGFSGILSDETAFQPDAENFYAGAKPTLDSVRGTGGKLIMLSSRAPGFFKKIVFDKIDSKSDNFAEVAPVPVKQPMTGVECWKNPNNGFFVIDLHYTADPAKRSPEFREALRKTIPFNQYMREYEKNWQTFEGLPVYPNFQMNIHVVDHKLEPKLGLPLLFGWDFGLTPAAIVAQMQGNSLLIMREWVSQNEAIKTFAPKVMSEVRFMFPEWNDPRKDFFHFIDPAGFQRAQTDARTCAQEMEESAGITNIEPGPVVWEERRSSVEHFLLKIDRHGPGLQIAREFCPSIIEGFSGGYRYADSQNNIESTRPMPLKNSYSHPHDALQYLCWGALSKQSAQIAQNISIALPSYQFGTTHIKRRTTT